ncbi:MAG: class I SAM-dependent methyltransferase [Cyanobacteria bacterium P01_H01_bin.121]
MATFLRDLSYRYQWLYDGISRLAALTVGGEARFRRLALEGIPLTADMTMLDLCCGSGQATAILVEQSAHVVGLDASPLSLQRASRNVPQAEYVESFAESTPFSDRHFDLVHTSAALHEMTTEQLQQIVQEVHRILKPGGVFTFVDFHPPSNYVFWPGISVFFYLFETETAWQFMRTNMTTLLKETGFTTIKQQLHAGGSLQVIHAQK